MNLLAIAPILLPLVSAVLMMTVGRANAKILPALHVLASAGLFATGIILVREVANGEIIVGNLGGWPAPFGIVLVIDLFSAMMVAISGFVAFCISLYSVGLVEVEQGESRYFALQHLLLLGVCGSFTTGDLFNLYVWFEVMLMASFVLLVYRGRKSELAGAIPYVVLNFIGSILFLSGIGLIYGEMGTLNLADLALKSRELAQGPGYQGGLNLALIAFALKMGLFPLFFWLPPAYPVMPYAVSALFSGLLSKVGLYALIRTVALLASPMSRSMQMMLVVASVATMVIGVLGAISQGSVRRILSFHMISQIGYMAAGLALFTVSSLAASLFYVIHYIPVKTSLFLVGGLISRASGDEVLSRIGGLMKSKPILALAFVIPALSLVGLPPLSGFFAKFSLVKAGLEAEAFVVVTTVVSVSLLTLFSMVKIWNEAFWKAPGQATVTNPLEESGPLPWLSVLAVFLMATPALLIGLFPEVLLELSATVSGQLVDPTPYIRAVLGGKAQ